jgi:hypothetical protein
MNRFIIAARTGHESAEGSTMRTIPALLVTNPFLAVLAIGCGASDHTLGFLPGSPDGDAGATGVTDATFAADVPSLIGDGEPVVSEASLPPPVVDAGFTAPDCPGCAFPPAGAPPCPGAPAIGIAYPSDGVLLPPNLNLLSVQWTPYDPAHFQRFEVDFDNAITHVRVVTKCAAQTTDTGQPPMPSGGCELALDPAVWTTIANQNRAGDGVAVTVRGTTDGSCATSSGKTTIWFAGEDLLGTLYYWKSTVSPNGVGGEIWVKDFGDPAPEQVEVIPASQGGCSGCHALSRDGVRMVLNSDDDDSDDEYTDMGALLVDEPDAVVPHVRISGSPGGAIPRGHPASCDPSASRGRHPPCFA